VVVGDGHVLSICDNNDNDEEKKKSFEKKNFNIGRGVG
jgi:hypothetical protein